MTDRLGEALTRCEADYKRDDDGTLIWEVTEDQALFYESARAWHTLTNPTDELIDRVVQLLRELIEKAKRSATDPEWEGSLDATVWTLAILDALSDTAEPTDVALENE